MTWSITMINVLEKYRHKALACEGFARNATDPATREAWAEIAIEWHALAHRTAQETELGSRSSWPGFSSVS
jgi:hypothetical protein